MSDNRPSPRPARPQLAGLTAQPTRRARGRHRKPFPRALSAVVAAVFGLVAAFTLIAMAGTASAGGPAPAATTAVVEGHCGHAEGCWQPPSCGKHCTPPTCGGCHSCGGSKPPCHSHSPKPTPSVSVSPSSTPTASPSVTPSPTPSVSTTPTPSASPSVSPTPSPTPSASVSPTPTLPPPVTSSPTPSPSVSPSPSVGVTSAPPVTFSPNPPPTHGGGLPLTGTPVSGMLIAAGVLIGTGLMLLLLCARWIRQPKPVR